MKIVVFDELRVGIVRDEGQAGVGVVDISQVLPTCARGTPQVVNELIGTFATVRATIEDIAATAAAIPIDEVHLLAPSPAPRTLLAAGGNYAAHVGEMARSGERAWQPPSWRLLTDAALFLKATTSIVGPSAAIELPDNGRLYHHEAELAVVIGQPARDVTPAEALDHVFGYTCLIDVTMRMTDALQEDRGLRKSFDTFTPVGPCIATVDEPLAPQDLPLRLWVNDELRQDSSTKEMVLSVADLVAAASSVMTLRPGDVIATGTPDGVGPIEVGDVITIEIDGIGRFSIPVRRRTPGASP